MAKTKGIYRRVSIWRLRCAGPDGKMFFESEAASLRREAGALLIRRKK